MHDVRGLHRVDGQARKVREQPLQTAVVHGEQRLPEVIAHLGQQLLPGEVARGDGFRGAPLVEAGFLRGEGGVDLQLQAGLAVAEGVEVPKRKRMDDGDERHVEVLRHGIAQRHRTVGGEVFHEAGGQRAAGLLGGGVHMAVGGVGHMAIAVRLVAIVCGLLARAVFGADETGIHNQPAVVADAEEHTGVGHLVRSVHRRFVVERKKGGVDFIVAGVLVVAEFIEL